MDPIIRIRNNRAGLIAEQSGCGKILGNSDIRLIWNDFPTESKVFRHLMNDALSIRPCPQASYGMSPRNQTFPAEVVRSERSIIRCYIPSVTSAAALSNGRLQRWPEVSRYLPGRGAVGQGRGPLRRIWPVVAQLSRPAAALHGDWAAFSPTCRFCRQPRQTIVAGNGMQHEPRPTLRGAVGLGGC